MAYRLRMPFGPLRLVMPGDDGPRKRDSRSVSGESKASLEAQSSVASEAAVAESPMTLVQNRHTAAAASPGQTLSRALVELRVFLPDHRGLRFPLNGGARATTAQLLTLIHKELQLDAAVASEVFALWMVSPLMEVQLKGHHQPFQLRLAWTELLAKFTAFEGAAVERDDPLLVFRRSVLLSKARQRRLCAQDGSGKLADLLLLDARECVLTGKYPVAGEDALALSALDLSLTWGPFNEKKHTPTFLRATMEDFLPDEHLARAQSTTLFGVPLPGFRGQEEELLSRYRALAGQSNAALRDRYLELAMELPYYGAAFFCGQVERGPGEAKSRSRKLLRRPSDSADLPVHVAVSREFISLIDRAAHTALVVESLLDCHWRMAEPRDKDPPTPGPRDKGKESPRSPKSPPASPDAAMPSLFLQLACEEEGRSRLLQVFTRQAVMVDALLSSLIQAACREEALQDSEAEEEEGPELFPDVESLPKTELLRAKLDRLCVATFDEAGHCLQAQGSLATALMPQQTKK